MDRKQLIENYKECLCYLCRQSALLEDVKNRVIKGEAVSGEEMASQLMYMDMVKKEFLDIKDKLGFEGGLDFMDDVRFQGFSFINGSLSGDYSNLLAIVTPMLNDFREEKQYPYEVAMLILFHYMKQEGYGKQDKEHKKKCMIRKLISLVKKKFIKKEVL